MSDFNIYFVNANKWTLLLLVIISLITYYTVYKKYREKSKLLIVTRIIIFLILIILLMRPVVSWQTIRRLKSEFLIFLDNSVSLKEQKDFNRKQIVSKMESIEKKLEQKNIEVHYNTFDDKIYRNQSLDDFNNSGSNTNLANVINYLKKQEKNRNIVGALILSDGVITEGQTPATIQNFPQIPIYTTGVGDTTGALDPAILNFDPPQSGFVGDTIMMNSEINPASSSDEIEIILKVNKSIIDRKIVKAGSAFQRKVCTFQYIPKKAGQKNLELVIQDENDKNLFNNNLSRRLKVRSKLANYVILSSTFNYESKYLAHVLSQQENSECYQMVAHQGKWIALEEPQEILNKSWDLIVLNGILNNSTARRNFQDIEKKVKADKTPVIAFINSKAEIDRLQSLIGMKVFQKVVDSPDSKNVQILMNEEWQNHGINLYLERSFGNDWWHNLPPIKFSFKELKRDTRFSDLIQTMDKDQNPVLSVSKPVDINSRRMAILSGSDFWKWQRMTIGSEVENFYNEMFLAITNYLTDTTDSSPIKIYTGKNKYRLGEKIQLQGAVTDVRGNTITDAVAKARVMRQNEEYSSFYIPYSEGQYESQLVVNQPGEYEIQLSAEQNGKPIDQVVRNFTVVDQPVEMETIQLKKESLQKISNNSRGAFYPIAELGAIGNQIDKQNKIITKDKKIRLWQWKYIFLMLIGVYLVELIYRKTKGYL
ncbi:MAG: hypothetical protein K9M80_00110 [Candidatus Marinimicrobia bacterium]|nr:hypothetical protein [Candidatus Neomarinimicrobiota bacterium]